MTSTNVLSKSTTALRLRLFLGILGALTLLGATTCLVILLGVGKWLVKEDSLQPATAIAGLSGNIPTRSLEAPELYRQGYAKEIWLTHPDVHADALKVLGISNPSEDDFNIRVLRRQGVPAKAIHVLDTPIVNTADELDVISAALKNSGGQRVIVITNKAHTRRVHILWSKHFASRVELIAHGLPDDEFVADRWWTDPGSRTQVTHEVLGIVNAWAGLPVRHVPHPGHEVVAQGLDTPQHTSAD